MAESAAATIGHHQPGHGPADGTKRDFWPWWPEPAARSWWGRWPGRHRQHEPLQGRAGASSTDVDITPIPAGSAITVVWRGKPIFVRHRTPKEISEAKDVKISDLIDPSAPATDAERTKAGHEQWLVVIGICTHLGCVPLGNKPTDPRGEYGGWFCPCHGSQYDTAGRVRQARRRSIWMCRPTHSKPTPRSRSAEGAASWPACTRATFQTRHQLDRQPSADLHHDAQGIRLVPDPEQFQLFLEFRRVGDGQCCSS